LACIIRPFREDDAGPLAALTTRRSATSARAPIRPDRSRHGPRAIRGRSVSLPTRQGATSSLSPWTRAIARWPMGCWSRVGMSTCSIVIPITQDRALPGNCSPGSRPMQGQPEPPGCSPKRANLPGRFSRVPDSGWFGGVISPSRTQGVTSRSTITRWKNPSPDQSRTALPVSHETPAKPLKGRSRQGLEGVKQPPPAPLAHPNASRIR